MRVLIGIAVLFGLLLWDVFENNGAGLKAAVSFLVAVLRYLGLQ